MQLFRFEVDARMNVVKTFCGMLSTIVALVMIRYWILPNEEVWFRRMWFTFTSLITFVISLGIAPLIWKVPKGTFYRVTLTEEHLQVESPHEYFGKDADIPLDDIAELRTVVSGTDERSHEVHAKDGTVFELKHNGGLRPDMIFERILELRPGLLHRRGPAKEFTGKA